MRTGLICAICLACMTALPAQAGSLIGEVVSANPDSGQLVLLPAGSNGFVSVQTSVPLPAFVQPGAHIRLNGKYIGNHSIFRAHQIGPAGPPAMRRDPTGVRSRINRFREQW